MATNIFTKFLTSEPEQDLRESIVAESIKFGGMDVMYIQREQITPDPILGESDLNRFNDVITIEMKLADVQNFNGDGAMFADWGMISTDQTFWVVSASRFVEEANKNYQFIVTEPREGDLIYMPVSNSLWEINKVKRDEEYYVHGKNYAWRLSCQLFEYNHDDLNTGVDEIDQIASATTVVDNLIKEIESADNLTVPIAEDLVEDDIIVDDRFDPTEDIL